MQYTHENVRALLARLKVLGIPEPVYVFYVSVRGKVRTGMVTYSKLSPNEKQRRWTRFQEDVTKLVESK